ncbi:hypothetical protein MMAD_20990 [Mycolicibacterium madagascariense]|uniref:DUF1501 domain-containing protein n=1 Tax=Mycolicibacterium madagascariense TaxID=212765 RepID=A0A7I7XF32_9MYCO|nr:DUF1501 domain-containing protein [Mycolicibacterium madagascariense]MCV7011255.1 DUF1501 domain-containing protein [Mycolicibacterium madagascariense]BBZ27804.1 hypothetical protein MMAD_20990 [Mycolicibacterium madagascariense]
MPEVNRRKFLIASAGVGALGVAGAVGITLPQLLDAGRDRPRDPDHGVLVIVTLYGGNDGLSTVVPLADGAYHDARPDLAYAPTELLALDAEYGLNPALKGLANLWHDQHLAVVRGVGYPNQDRSHFRSMDIWQTASPAAPVGTGWIGRWLDATGDDPVRAVNIGPVLTPMAVGKKQSASALSESLPPVDRDWRTTLTALAAEDPSDTPAMSGVCASYRASNRSDSAFRPVTLGADPTATATDANQLVDDLDLVAKCIRAHVPTQVYMVDLLGFDTHADERGTQQALLQKLDDALTPFMQKMRASEQGKNVVVMVYSEFGRRVAANASQGTDHGTSAPVLVLGRSIKGGFYGDQPSLTDLTDGDLKTTTDFRDVYSELLTGVLHTDPVPSVGPGRRSLGFL